MSPTSTFSLACAIALGLTASLAGCSGADDNARNAGPRTDSTAAAGGRPLDYPRIIASAQNDYTYENPPQNPVPATHPDEFDESEDEGTEPKTITFATATLIPNKTPYGRIIGRIVTDVELKKLKILPNTNNYLWRDESDKDPRKWDIYTIPESSPSSGKQVKWSRRFTDGPHTRPHLVKAMKSRMLGEKRVVSFAFGVCTDDCPTGHCGLQ